MVRDRSRGSQSYPWYDSGCLSKYSAPRAVIRDLRPAALGEFERAMEPLRTRLDFQEKILERPFDKGTLDEIARVTATLRPGDLELHEVQRCGRFVIHDHPVFAALQRRAVSMISAEVGEPLEVGYNFLSLY